MTYWLGIDTPQVWEEAKQKYNLREPHPFGFPEGRSKSVRQMRVGDRIINYLTKHHRFFAVWEVTEERFPDPSHIYAGKVFPECVTNCNA
jgi:hypothetical protein